jgi:hypothetical protein
MCVLDSSFAASVRRASSRIVIKRWSAIGSILSTNTASLFDGSSFKASAAKSDAQGGEDTGDRKCATDEAYRHHRGNLRPVGVDVILDHNS